MMLEMMMLGRLGLSDAVLNCDELELRWAEIAMSWNGDGLELLCF
jgi:hypothetical protein